MLSLIRRVLRARRPAADPAAVAAEAAIRRARRREALVLAAAAIGDPHTGPSGLPTRSSR